MSCRFRMNNFGQCKVGSWRCGQTPRYDSILFVVGFAQKNTAYCVRYSDEMDFVEWLSWHAERKGFPRLTDKDGDVCEAAYDHLERIGCDVTRHEFCL